MHNPVSNGTQSFVQGCSPGRTKAATVDAPSIDGRIDSTRRVLTSENTINHRSSTEEIHIEEYDVLTKLSPTMVKLDGMYVNKDTLKMHLARFTIANHFNYKVRTSHKECLHVVCLDDNCG